MSSTPGPPLAALTRRLAGIPADFLNPATVVPAVLGDAVFMVHTAVLRAADIETVRGWCATQHGRDATAVAAWLIAEPQLVAYTRDRGPAARARARAGARRVGRCGGACALARRCRAQGGVRPDRVVRAWSAPFG